MHRVSTAEKYKCTFMTDQLQETQRYLADKITAPPTIGIVLGTGLGGLAQEIQAEYSDFVRRPAALSGEHRGNPRRES